VCVSAWVRLVNNAWREGGRGTSSSHDAPLLVPENRRKLMFPMISLHLSRFVGIEVDILEGGHLPLLHFLPRLSLHALSHFSGKNALLARDCIERTKRNGQLREPASNEKWPFPTLCARKDSLVHFPP